MSIDRIQVTIEDPILGTFKLQMKCNLSTGGFTLGGILDGRFPSVFRTLQERAMWLGRNEKLIKNLLLFLAANNPFVPDCPKEDVDVMYSERKLLRREEWLKNGGVQFEVDWPVGVFTLHDLMAVFPPEVILNDN